MVVASTRGLVILLSFLTVGLALPGCAVFDGLQGDGDEPADRRDAVSDVTGLDADEGGRDAEHPDVLNDVDHPDGLHGDDTRGPDGGHDPPEGSGLVFRVQPGDSTAGELIPGKGGAPAWVTVEFQGDDGTLLQDVSDKVTLSLVDGSELMGDVEVDALNGVAVFENISVQRAGTGLKLRASAGGQGLTVESEAFEVSHGPVVADRSSLTADPASARADGQEVIALKLKLRDAFDNPIPGVDVEFSSSNSNDEFLNADDTSERQVQTDDLGEYTMRLRSREIGTRTVRVEGGGVQLELEVDFVTGDLAELAFDSSIGDITAGEAMAFSVLLQDSDGRLIDTDAQVSLELVGGAADATLSGTPTTRAVQGTATFDDVTIEAAGTNYKVRAKVGGVVAESDAFSVHPAAPAQWQATATPTQVSVDVSSGALISTGVVADRFGNPTPDAMVSLTVTGTTNSWTGQDGSGSTSDNTFTGTTNASGIFSVRLNSNIAEQKNITVKVDDGAVLSEDLTVDFVPGALSRIDVATQPISPVQAGKSLGSVAFHLKDAKGNRLRTPMTLQVILEGGSSEGKLTIGTTASRSHNLTSDGQGAIVLNAPWVDKVGSYNIKARMGSIDVTSDGFQIKSGDLSHSRSTITVHRSTGVIADDLDEATLTLTVTDDYGNPLVGREVDITKTGETPAGGSGTMGVSVGGMGGVTDAAGKASGWVKASSRAGTVVIKGAAKDSGSFQLFDTPVTVEFVEPTFNISANVDYLPADFELRLTNGTTSSSAITATGDVVVFSLPRHSAYDLAFDGAADTLCELPGTSSGTITANLTVQVKCADRWKKISSSKTSPFAAAVRKDGTLWAWGTNNYGQLGDGTQDHKASPGRVGTKTDWVDVSAGGSHVLALDSTGKLWAWGRNLERQVSGVLLQSPITTPVQISRPPGQPGLWTRIAAGGNFSVATMNNVAYIWGRNLDGQTPPIITEPQRVELQGCGAPTTNKACVTADVVDGLAAGHRHFMVVGQTPEYTGSGPMPARDRKEGVVWRFFANAKGQLGLGDTQDRPNTFDISSPTYNYGQSWLQVDVGRTSSVGITLPERHLYVWGERFGMDPLIQTSTPFGQSTAVTWKRASAGETHFLAINDEDRLYGWGEASDGELGAPASKKHTDVRVQTAVFVSDISAGFRRSFYIERDTGRLFARGSNIVGGLGVSQTTGALAWSETFLEVKTNP